jgi:CRISPR-associated protein Csb2
MKYLVITIRFLTDRYHGRTDNGRAPEWPPSPLRLYQAILAGVADRWYDPQVRDRELAAFEWFQSLEEPAGIIAPAFQHGRPLLKYVPENLSDVDVEKRDAKVSRPTLFCGQPMVIYYWPIDPNDEQYAKTITYCAQHCRALGWGIDMAIGEGTIVDCEPEVRTGEKWLPVQNPEDGVPLRVPRPSNSSGQCGTLNELRNRFAASLKRIAEDGRNPVPPLTAFRIVSYRRVTDPPSRRWVAFRLRHPTEDRAAAFPQIRANHVAAMLRNATARLAEQQHMPPDWIDRYVHGHRRGGDDSSPRFSYLPLPSLEPRSGKSTVVRAIRRVLVAELMDTAESHLPWVRQMLPGNFLTDDKTGDRKALLTPLTPGDGVLRQYTADRRGSGYATWATVTPVVLPGSDEGKFAKAEKLFFKALRHAGYAPEALAELEFRNVSFWPGGDLALRFCRPDYLKENFWSVYHVRLRWKQPVQGPIALGAGRHCGLGVFARMEGATRMD